MQYVELLSLRVTLVEGAAAESRKGSGKVLDELWNLVKVGSIFSIYKLYK